MQKCRICNHDEVKMIDLDNFTLSQCTKCKYAQLEPYPTQDQVDEIYRKEYFDNKKRDDHLSDSKKKYNFVKEIFDNNLNFAQPNLLDFGCGTGNFLKYSVDHFNSYGYDISKYAAEYVNDQLEIPSKFGKIRRHIYSPREFDCITMFDVIEHLTNYEDILSMFYEWLDVGGYIILTTPNINVWDRYIFQKKWYGFKKYPEHINFFSPKSIALLLENNGFKIKKIKTWGFVRTFGFINDSYFKDGITHKFINDILNFASLEDKEIYIPMVDMIVVAEKNENT